MTYSTTKSASFTITHARQLSSKVAADMHVCAQYYGQPSEEKIRNFAEELAQYINMGYVEEYEFGYQKNDKRVVSWRYQIDENGLIDALLLRHNMRHSNGDGASLFSQLEGFEYGRDVARPSRKNDGDHEPLELSYESEIGGDGDEGVRDPEAEQQHERHRER